MGNTTVIKPPAFDIDDIKAALSGMLSPTLRENFLGYAEIREVFTITKVGKVAGCMVTDGHISRGSKIRLIRDGRIVAAGSGNAGAASSGARFTSSSVPSGRKRRKSGTKMELVMSSTRTSR
mgnify:CR=1 FL=1